MAEFSKRSMKRLHQCDFALIEVFEEVVKQFDCTVLQGHRRKREQNQAYRTGHSKLRFPQSKHNRFPSAAIDVAPYPIDWQDRDRMTYFAGCVMGTAAAHGFKLRWGGDWNRDTQTKDNGFDDLVHFELVDD